METDEERQGVEKRREQLRGEMKWKKDEDGKVRNKKTRREGSDKERDGVRFTDFT